MTDPILPSGLRIGAGIDTAGRDAVRIDVAISGAADPLAIVIPPGVARQAALYLIQQEDRRARALGALLLKQAALSEKPAASAVVGLQLIEGGRR